jgi:hypothetical protein
MEKNYQFVTIKFEENYLGEKENTEVTSPIYNFI